MQCQFNLASHNREGQKIHFIIANSLVQTINENTFVFCGFWHLITGIDSAINIQNQICHVLMARRYSVNNSETHYWESKITLVGRGGI